MHSITECTVSCMFVYTVLLMRLIFMTNFCFDQLSRQKNNLSENFASIVCRGTKRFSYRMSGFDHNRCVIRTKSDNNLFINEKHLALQFSKYLFIF